jgi:calcium-dependent protein kinase
VCCDFGQATFFAPGQAFSERLGSPYYIAPEVLDGRYGPEADIWSCGVILYILLCGGAPFDDPDQDALYHDIRHADLDLAGHPWPSISADAKDCVRRMLTRDPRARATAAAILQHPWLQEHGVATDAPLDDAIVARLSTFAAMSRAKQEFRMVVARALPADEIAGLRAIFQSIDVDQSGTITVQELCDALAAKGAALGAEEARALHRLLDLDASGSIEYSEFLAATLSQHQLEKEENLRAAFAVLDRNGDGVISREELQSTLSVSRVHV